jgi:hypothetical protein
MKRVTIALGIGSLFLLVSPLFTAGASAAGTYNHDMSVYKGLANAAMDLVKGGKMAEAHAKTKELEKAWDANTKDLRRAEPTIWRMIDKQMDVAIGATDPANKGTAEKATVELRKYLHWLGKVPAE